MKRSLKTGISFGLTSGVITTLALIVGLHAGTHSQAVVIGGILTIAIADAFSDALGIHVSEESEAWHAPKQIWASTIFTFLSKFACAMSFIVLFLLLPFSTAIIVNVFYGLCLLTALSFYLAREQKVKPWGIITEHLLVALVVIVLAHYVGSWILTTFG